MHSQLTNSGEASVLASLRALLPDRRLRLAEAVTIAERQAERLLDLQGVDQPPVPVKVVTTLPRVIVEADPDLPRQAASGVSHWDATRRAWIICLNPDEPRTRQRLTVLHEYKHIIDHGHAGLGGSLPATIYGLPPVEFIAEYFAGCVLMPASSLKQAWYQGFQQLPELAGVFDVSVRAIEVRLSQLGLREAAPAAEISTRSPYRRQRSPRPQRYYRPLSRTWRPNSRTVVAA